MKVPGSSKYSSVYIFRFIFFFFRFISSVSLFNLDILMHIPRVGRMKEKKKHPEPSLVLFFFSHAEQIFLLLVEGQKKFEAIFVQRKSQRIGMNDKVAANGSKRSFAGNFKIFSERRIKYLDMQPLETGMEKNIE